MRGDRTAVGHAGDRECVRRWAGIRHVQRHGLAGLYGQGRRRVSEVPHLKKIYNDFKPDIVHTGYVWQVGILASMLNLHPHLSMPWGSDILVEPDKYFFLKAFVKKVMIQCYHVQCDAEFVKQK